MGLLGMVLALWAFVSHVAATLASLRMHRRKPSAPGAMPAVTVLKPLRGIDDQLAENLETFFALDYPRFQLVFGAADPGDPALDVARTLCRRHPEVDARIVTGSSAEGLNPKVQLLAVMSRGVKTELVAVSDSNVRVRPSWLKESVGELRPGPVVVVSNIVAGVGERTLGATLENLQLNGFIAPAVCLGLALRRPPCLVGKSMVLRRAALEAVGGWEALSGVLAEDYVFGRMVEARGWEAAISPHVVETVNERWGLSRFLERHDRWLKMRWRLNAGALVIEALANVTALSFLWVLLAGGASWALVGAAACILGRVLLEWVATRSLLRGERTGFAKFLLVPVRDLLLAALWVNARLSSKIRWRGGRHLVLGRGTVLSEPTTPASSPAGSLEEEKLSAPAADSVGVAHPYA